MRYPDQHGRIALVTGGTDGVGRAVAERLATLGATTLLTARNAAKGDRMAAQIRAATGNDNVHVVPLDLAGLTSVRAAAAYVLDGWDALHLVITNAGVTGAKQRSETVDGLETTIGVNHFAHAALIDLLTPRLRDSAPSRVVVVSSEAHARSRGGIDFDDVMLTRSYKSGMAYGRSKLANLLYARELARRLEGSGVTVAAAHPGSVDTPMMRASLRGPLLRHAYRPLRRFLLISPEDAAAALLTVALDPALAADSGKYYEVGVEAQPHAMGRDDEAARRLWDVTDEVLAAAP